MAVLYFYTITYKRRFMLRKPLDVRKERVRLERQRQTKTQQILIGWVAVFRPYCLIYTLLRGSRQAERGINSRACIFTHIFQYQIRNL